MFWRIGLPVLVALVALGFGSQFVKDYREMATTIAENKRQYELLDSRYRASLRMVERRDAAIAQSACKEKIQYWIKNPSLLPAPTPSNPWDACPNCK